MIPGTPAELTSLENIASIAAMSEKLSKDPDVKSIVSPLTLLSTGTLPQGVTLDQSGVATSIVFGSDGKPKASFAELFPSGNELVQITLVAGLSVDEQGAFSNGCRRGQGCRPAGRHGRGGLPETHQ